jgi:hypothetical protein
MPMQADEEEHGARVRRRRRRSEDLEPFENFSGRSYRRTRPYRLPDEVLQEIQEAENRNSNIIMNSIDENICFDEYIHDDIEV